MKIKHLYLILIVLIFSNCKNSNNSLRFPNGTTLISDTYLLDENDTCNLYFENNDTIFSKQLPDSLKYNTDTIRYCKPFKNETTTIFGKIHQQVTNTRNKNSIEYYRFIKGGVYLIGYKTLRSENIYTKFDEPLIILPSNGKQSDSTVTIMKTITKNSSINETNGLKVKSIVRLTNTGKICINTEIEDYFMYEITITQDFSINYGEKGLILPEVVLIKSSLLYSSKSGLIAEWSLKNKETGKEILNKNAEHNIYLELITYSKLFN